jgi:hypothetical protein
MRATLDQAQHAAHAAELEGEEVEELVSAMRRRGARRANQLKNAPEHRHGASMYPIHSAAQLGAMPALLRPPADCCALD